MNAEHIAQIAHEVLTATFYPFLDAETTRRFAAGDYIAADKADIARSLASRVAEGQLVGASWEVMKLEALGWGDVAELASMAGQIVEEILAGRTDSALAAARGLCAKEQRELAESVWRTARAALRRNLTAAAWMRDRQTAAVLGRAMTALGEREIAVGIWAQCAA